MRLRRLAILTLRMCERGVFLVVNRGLGFLKDMAHSLLSLRISHSVGHIFLFFAFLEDTLSKFLLYCTTSIRGAFPGTTGSPRGVTAAFQTIDTQRRVYYPFIQIDLEKKILYRCIC